MPVHGGVGEWNLGALLLVDGLGRLQFGISNCIVKHIHLHIQANKVRFDCARFQVVVAVYLRVRLTQFRLAAPIARLHAVMCRKT